MASRYCSRSNLLSVLTESPWRETSTPLLFNLRMVLAQLQVAVLWHCNTHESFVDSTAPEKAFLALAIK